MLGAIVAGAGNLAGMAGGMAGGAAGAAGFSGAAGGFGSTLFAGAMGAQMGMGLGQSFGGSSMGGYAPTYAVRLTKRGKQLEKNVFGKIKTQYKTGYMDENLARPYVQAYVGKMKRELAQQAKLTDQALMGAATRRVRTGRGAMGMLGAGMARMKGLAGPERAREDIRIENFRNTLANLQNIMAIERQTPILRAQSQLARGGLGQLRSAAQGEAIGETLNLLGYMYRPRG
jgi:hypothetical protein